MPTADDPRQIEAECAEQQAAWDWDTAQQAVKTENWAKMFEYSQKAYLLQAQAIRLYKMLLEPNRSQ